MSQPSTYSSHSPCPFCRNPFKQQFHAGAHSQEPVPLSCFTTGTGSTSGNCGRKRGNSFHPIRHGQFMTVLVFLPTCSEMFGFGMALQYLVFPIILELHLQCGRVFKTMQVHASSTPTQSKQRSHHVYEFCSWRGGMPSIVGHPCCLLPLFGHGRPVLRRLLGGNQYLLGL